MSGETNLLILYSRDDCHLCDVAESLVLEVIHDTAWQLQKQNIDLDETLRERYGWSIPVLSRADTGEEINWPFPPSRVRHLIQKN